MDRVQRLQKQLQSAQLELDNLNQDAETARRRLERAEKLILAIGDEGARWEATVKTIKQQIALLTGDVFVSTACISYHGPFSGALIVKSMKDGCCFMLSNALKETCWYLFCVITLLCLAAYIAK